MLTYTTLGGKVYDLTDLSTELRAFFDCSLEAYQRHEDWVIFVNRMNSVENPLLRETDGWITRAVYDHPLYQAVYDLGDRLGIRQGRLASDGAVDIDSDPLQDEWLSTSEAAQRKGVTYSGLNQAIKRGQVLARPAKPGGSHLKVSARSLALWEPMAVRQTAGRQVRRRKRDIEVA